MDITKFIRLRPFLYHLTDRRNLQNLLDNGGILYSTTELVKKSSLSTTRKSELIRERRPIHEEISVNGFSVYIRDQRPISIQNLKKCIPKEWIVGDYIQHLNKRVFFWPSVSRLTRHYNRYAHEKPVIIKVDTSLLLQLNPHSEFCRLNSGATRSSSHHDGGPPPRGGDTFLSATDYPSNQGSVAEVTFAKICHLPENILIGNTPNGQWEPFSFSQ